MKNAPYSRKTMDYLISIIAGHDACNIPDDISWPEIIALARSHKVIPQLYQNMKDHLPASEREQMKKSFLANMAKNTFLTEELLRILQLLKSHNITAVGFKGPLLALQAFDDISMRQFDDIDLIIPQDQVLNAVKLLNEDDYKSDLQLNDSAMRGYLKSRQDWTFHTEKSNICLDIKPAIASHALYSSKKLKNLLSRRQVLKHEGLDLCTLSPEDTLEAICVHGAHHLWHRLSWILDVSKLSLTLGEKGISSVIADARKNGTLRRVLLGLNLAKEILKTDIPESIKDLISSDPTIKRLTDISINTLYSYPTDTRGLRNWHFQLQSTEKIRDKVREMVCYLFVPSKIDFKIIALPSCAYLLYHVIRPLRLFCSALRPKSSVSPLEH